MEEERLVIWCVLWSQLWKALECRIGLALVLVHPSKCLCSLLLFLSTCSSPSEANVMVVGLSCCIALDRKALKETLQSTCLLPVGCKRCKCTLIFVLQQAKNYASQLDLIFTGVDLEELYKNLLRFVQNYRVQRGLFLGQKVNTVDWSWLRTSDKIFLWKQSFNEMDLSESVLGLR